MKRTVVYYLPEVLAATLLTFGLTVCVKGCEEDHERWKRRQVFEYMCKANGGTVVAGQCFKGTAEIKVKEVE